MIRMEIKNGEMVHDGKTIWINNESRCLLRITGLQIDRGRMRSRHIGFIDIHIEPGTRMVINYHGNGTTITEHDVRRLLDNNDNDNDSKTFDNNNPEHNHDVNVRKKEVPDHETVLPDYPYSTYWDPPEKEKDDKNTGYDDDDDDDDDDFDIEEIEKEE